MPSLEEYQAAYKVIDDWTMGPVTIKTEDGQHG